MGTTAEKLAYLKETKNQIKQALETPSNVMRDYANWIKKYVDNQPTNTVSDGVCTNALDVPLVSLGVDGNSEQKSYSGKNLLNAERDLTFTRFLQLAVNIPAGTYHLTNTSLSSSDGSYDIKIAFNDNSKTIALYNERDITITLTTDESTVYLYSKGSYAGSEGITATIKDLMISKVGGEYEPYVGGQPSPNPEYPQDIEVIDGCNLVFGNGTNEYVEFWATGQIKSSMQNRLTNLIKIKENTPYKISLKEIMNVIAVSYFKKDGTFLSGEEIANINICDITTPKNSYYMRIGINLDGKSPMDANSFITYELQLTKGTTPKPYLPHGHIGLRQSGKNKLSGLVKGRGLNTSTGAEVDNPEGALSDYIPVNFIENESYYLSGLVNTISSFVALYDKSKNYITRNGGGKRAEMYIKLSTFSSISTMENVKYIRVYQYTTSESTGIIGDVDNAKIQLEEGSTATPFEPYHSPKLYPINLNGNSIAKVGDVKDLLKIYRNGDVEIEKKIEKVVLDGSEYWSNQNGEYDTNERIFFGSQIDLINANMSNRKGLCNYFKNYNGSIQSRNVNITAFNFNSEAKYSNYIYIKIDKDKLSTQDANGFKQWLSEHPTEVDYQLAEPETIKLPSIEPIELWEGTNKFELITNLDTTFEMEYVVNKEYLEIQNLLNIVEGENI